MSANSITRHAISYSSATLVTQLVGLAAAVLSRRFLGPVSIGVWAVVQVVVEYSAYSSLGVSEAAPREIPFYKGKGDEAAAERVKNAVFSFATASAVVVAALVSAFALSRRPFLSEEMFWGLLFASAIIVLQRVNNLLVTLLRAYKEFALAGRQMTLSAVVNAVLTAVLAYRFRFYGFMAALCLSFVFNIVYILWKSRIRIAPCFELKEGWALVRYGLPLQLLGVINTFLGSIDRILIAALLGFRDVGLYGVAVMGYSYLAGLPNAVATVLVPHFHEEFGKRQNPRELLGYLQKSSRAFSELMIVLVGCGWFLSPLFIRWALPEFAEAVPAAQWMMLGSYFLALTHPYSTFLIVIKRHLPLFGVLGVLSALALAVYPPAVLSPYGIQAVAIAGACLALLRFLMVYFLASRQVHEGTESTRELTGVLLRFAALAALIAAFEFLFARLPELLRPPAQTALFLAASWPLCSGLYQKLLAFRSLRMA